MHKGRSREIRIVQLIPLACVFCCVATAGEYAVLQTGFRIQASRHDVEDGIVRLYTKDGMIQVLQSQIAAFEQEEDLPKPPPPQAISPAPTSAPKPVPVLSTRELVQLAALNNGLPPEFVHSVAKVESAYRSDAVSPKGAIGVMQLMPATAAALSADPRDPAQNVEAGARLLRELLIKYQNYPDQVRRALAAYNAGSGAVDRYNGVPPYRETQMYVEKVLQNYQHTRK
jgi:soluble lytic murein transglycosylase-like protein